MEKFRAVVLPKSPAARTIASLQPPVRQLFWKRLEDLCASPSTLSERAGYVAPVNGQLYRFKFTLDGIRFYFTIVFKFADSRDENTLLIADIMLRQM